MDAPLDEQYLTWLYSKVAPVKARRLDLRFWRLFKILYTKEFVWIIPNDNNRVEDGRDLRYRFLEEQQLDHVDPNWMGLGCSMFELILAVGDRLAFQIGGDQAGWFWELLANLGLNTFSDARSFADEEVEDVLDNLIWRTYRKNGKGGLFPLRHPHEDQTKVEIWYQMSEFILEYE